MLYIIAVLRAVGQAGRRATPQAKPLPQAFLQTYLGVIYIYIYIYMYNPHLGLINAPPPYLFFPPNDLFHYSFTIKKARQIHNYGQDFINHISPLMGGPLCENNIWDVYIINVT